MLLVVNIGNTNTQTALWDGSSISDVRTFPTKDFTPPPFDGPVAVASVVPDASVRVTGPEAFFLKHDVKTGMDTSLMDLSTMGADRLANAIALCHFERLPAICVDFGTAITLEVVDGGRRLLGGAILPGRSLQRKSLRDYTAKLPMLDISHVADQGPALNTRDAISFGVDAGTAGAVLELISRTRKVLGVECCSLVGAGGDAKFFDGKIPGMEIRGSEYTLWGIAKAWELNHQ